MPDVDWRRESRMGYTWNGYVEFAIQLDVPVEHAEDGSLTAFTNEIGGDSKPGFPGPRCFDIALSGVSGPALGAMIAEQRTQSIFVLYRGPAALLDESLAWLRETCDRLFPRVA
jgi:hypothetical protein